MKCYIHQYKNWTSFEYDESSLCHLLETVHHEQGLLLGRMSGLGFQLRDEAVLATLTADIIKSSEIEGEKLNTEEVRSSIARRLGMKFTGLTKSSHYVDGIVEMMIDATRNYNDALTQKRIFGWHAALFPTGYSGPYKIDVGKWRRDKMRVISGGMGNEAVHYEAPEPERVPEEMKKFFAWFNSKEQTDGLIKAAVAHFWFVTIHPFDDGNGRIARALTDMLLARCEQTELRFYSMSEQIQKERADYYKILEATQRGNGDITLWLAWFLQCLERAVENSKITLGAVLSKTEFWQTNRDIKFNDRQKKMLNMMLDGFEGNLTTAKWAKICSCSPDTALNDITGLIRKKILCKTDSGGRSTAYRLNS